MDHVDKVLAQWHSERPDLDVTSMGLVGRLKRTAGHLSQGMGKTFAGFGLNSASFDVLATLRRSGPPYRLLPSDLLAAMMVTSGTMTNRIDQLERAGWVKREHNPKDGRSVFISLTDKGFELIDAAVTAHVKTQDQLTSGLSPTEYETLDRLLAKFLQSLENK
ncbi:Transcriptional regulator, MarR family [hydrothermal vent metagenome]|uniref:Transcriptional regulator, MarR family n=1 Tax=hydrothermal vent metagenome TaxID=652676 RepID=A0A3B0SQX4_9ZZZZ